MLLAASALALAQTRPVAKHLNSKLRDDAPGPSKGLLATPKETLKRRSVGGTVLGPDGKPVSSAAVSWVSFPKANLNPRAIPKDQQARSSNKADVLGETQTEANGRFSLAADFDPNRYNHLDGLNVILLVKAPGMGMLAHMVKVGTTDIALRLPPEVVIRGRLLTPGGIPAAGVRVTLDGFHDEMTDAGGMSVGLTPSDDLIPSYWLKPRTTDADGRFTFHGLPQGTYAQFDFWHPDYAVDEVTVDTNPQGVIKAANNDFFKALEITPVKSMFTHTLEPARPVQGRVTDKQTGKPFGGLLIQMTPMRRHGGTAFYVRTDSDGHYRVSGHAAEHYWTTVYPPADSGYLAAQDKNRSWPAGAKFLEKDFALDKGRIVRGLVIDADTRRPIAGAAVGYQPRGSNPNNRDEYHLSNTVLTDSKGRFAITTLQGQGTVAVQTPDGTYMQVPARPLISAQGVASIDVPNDGEPKPVEITVRKGAVLKARVIDPDGKAVPDVAASCEGIAPVVLIHAWEPSIKGVFRLPGVDPAKTYRVFFIQPDRQLGAVVDLEPGVDSKQPVDITLKPMARVHGKVVNENGSDAEGAQVNPMIAMGQPKEGEMTRAEIMRDTTNYIELMGQKGILLYLTKITEPKPKGVFVIDTLMPGARFYIAAGAGRREAYLSLPPLKPGEDLDLGTITIKERKP